MDMIVNTALQFYLGWDWYQDAVLVLAETTGISLVSDITDIGTDKTTDTHVHVTVVQ